jgi:hypothetical protein
MENQEIHRFQRLTVHSHHRKGDLDALRNLSNLS